MPTPSRSATPSESCFYEGTVRHRRVSPAREFRYRLALAYIDLEELPLLLGGRLVDPRPGLLRFRRADYLPDRPGPLADAARDLVAEETGVRPLGPVRLLTQLRSYGRCFNPASFYYCFAGNAGSEHLQAIIAEVTNTPWGERHAYVLPADQRGGPLLRAATGKRMHVSPLMGMDQAYAFRAAAPGPTLALHIESSEDGERVFDATLSLRRRALSAASARRQLVRYPFETARVLTLIYTQALRARLAGARYHPHPSERAA